MIAASPAVGFLAKTALSARAIRDLLDGDGMDNAGHPVSGPRKVSDALDPGYLNEALAHMEDNR